MTPEESARQSRPFPDPEHSIAPRKPRTIGGAVYLTVLAATGTGLLLVAAGPWRLGLLLMGASLMLAGLARLVLRNDAAGMLGARSKLVDVITLLGLGTAVCAIAIALRGGPL